MTGYLNGRDISTLILNGGAFFLVIGVLTTSLLIRVRGKKDNDLMIILLFLNAVNALSNTVSYIIDGKDIDGIRTVKIISTTLFYISLVFTALVWRWYIAYRFKCDITKGWRKTVLNLVAAANLVIMLTNPFTGLFFRIEQDGTFVHGVLYAVIYAVIIIYVFVGFFDIATSRRKGEKKSAIPVWFYMIPAVVGGIFTFIVPDGPSFAPIGIAVSILFTHAGTVVEAVDADLKELMTDGG